MRVKLFKASGLFLAVLLILFAGYARAEKTVLLTFTGDCTLGGKDEGRGLDTSFESYAKKKGYDWFFANFREMFEQDDQTVINLEGVLTDNTKGAAKKTHAFRGPTKLVEILTRSSIEAASLSNNHAMDYGASGLSSTKQTLEENGIGWFKDCSYYLYHKDGITVALFALQNSVIYTQQPEFYGAIRKAREQDGADAVVVCWHTGTEYRTRHNEDTELRTQKLIENGADLVIINHPHVAQGMNIHNNRCIFYSLGNFVFGGNPNIRTGKNSKDPLAVSLYGMVIQAKLTFSNEGRYLGQQVTVYPVFSSGTNPDYQPGDKKYPANNYQPIRLTLEQAAPVYEIIRRDSGCEIPEMKEKDGLAEIDFPYLPAFDGIMLPEDSDGASAVMPEASNPKPTRENKHKTGD